jgi:predicted nucleic acid-binding protein
MSPSKATSTIYWDSCIFIAWIKDEKRPAGEMDGVYECVDRVQAGTIRLITSVFTRTEVFESDLPAHVRSQYAALLNRRNVCQLDQDLRVAELAREIREHYQAENAKDRKGTIATADAVHLATAIHYKADALYTFDQGKRGGRGLLSLNGDVAGHAIRVCKPEVTQFRLRF